MRGACGVGAGWPGGPRKARREVWPRPGKHWCQRTLPNYCLREGRRPLIFPSRFQAYFIMRKKTQNKHVFLSLEIIVDKMFLESVGGFLFEEVKTLW